MKSVERVTGRLSWGRAAGAGAASGLWLGLFLGLVTLIFSPQPNPGVGYLFGAVLLGAAFGILFGIVSYAVTRNRRDFSSVMQVVASTYSLVVDPEVANRARNILGVGLGGTAVTPVDPPVHAPSAADGRTPALDGAAERARGRAAARLTRPSRGAPGQAFARSASQASTSSAVRGMRGRQVLVAVRGHEHVVLDAHADAAELLRHGEVVGLEVQARLDREDHAGLDDAVDVELLAGLRAVVHVEPEVVARAVHHVAAVALVARALQRLGGSTGGRPHSADLPRDDVHRGRVHLAEHDAGLHDRERGVGGLEHGLVDLALHRR